MNEQDVLMQLIQRKGADHQEWVFVGEAGELLDAVADFKRGRCDTDHIAEEIADVEIMLEQLKIIYDAHEAVDAAMELKIKRLRQLLNMDMDE